MNFLKKQEELGVVRVRLRDEKISFHFTKVDRIGEVLEIDKSSLQITNSIDILKELVGVMPIILIFTGSKILYSDKEELFISSENNFYSTSYKNKKGKKFLAVIRKSEVDTLLKTFYDKNFFIVDLFVGVLGFNLLYNSNLFAEKKTIDSVSFQYKNQDLVQVLPNLQDDDSSDDLSPEDETLILSSVLNLFYPKESIINGYNNEELKKSREELKYKIDFNLYAKIGGVFFFITIIIGYFSGEFFALKNTKADNYFNSGVKKQRILNSLSSEESNKVKMLELSGFFKSDFSTLYINELIKVLPKGIILKTLNVFPVKNEISEKKRISFDDKLIIVEGSFEEITDFNFWTSKLKEVLNVEKVDIIITKKEKVMTFFELQILLK